MNAMVTLVTGRCHDKSYREPSGYYRKIRNFLIKVYNPRSIYIFGSYAWGTPDEHSDLDFAVIVDESDLDKASRIRLSSAELWGIGIPTDILVYTKNEIENKSDHNSTLK